GAGRGGRRAVAGGRRPALAAYGPGDPGGGARPPEVPPGTWALRRAERPEGTRRRRRDGGRPAPRPARQGRPRRARHPLVGAGRGRAASPVGVGAGRARLPRRRGRAGL
ncbi:MAG: FIG00511363: hypothetical protein, partial [uncultured Nocardioides sp.]